MKILNLQILKHMLEKSALHIFMIAILLALTFSFSPSLLVYGGEIHTYTDKSGNTVISNSPVPEKYRNKAKKIESYNRDSPTALERYEEKRVLKEEREYNRGAQLAPQAPQAPEAPEAPLSRKGTDASCKRECSVDRSTCQSDCGYDKDSYVVMRCKESCSISYDSCVRDCKY